MANEDHVRRLRRGVKSWNAWRRDEVMSPDLSWANLSSLDLTGADLSGADLKQTRLVDATLAEADLGTANLAFANLRRASLRLANLSDAELTGANLSDADLSQANLSRARMRLALFQDTEMRSTDLEGAVLGGTILASIDLASAVGLEKCVHVAPSIIDYRTFQQSRHLPLSFLRGVGLPDNFIEYLPSLLAQPIQLYSCFISYSSKDQQFADRLHADLQSKGVRCWFATHDMPIGGKILDEIDAAIRHRDKVLLILSEYSIASNWVEDEVTKGFEEERRHGRTVLFPIRLDDAVMDTNEPWAAKLRNRHIGDFRRWKEHDEYQKSFARVLRDLAMKKE